jgi:hypothetical protein
MEEYQKLVGMFLVEFWEWLSPLMIGCLVVFVILAIISCVFKERQI